MKRFFLPAVFILFHIMVQVAPAAAMQDAIQVHGFGGWAYGRTDQNNYMVGTEDGSYSNSYFALNVSASPYEKFSANVQTLWKTTKKGLETDFDYAFAEWAFFDWLKLRVGKVKCPFGIYAEVFDVGTLRPFYTLPPSLYAPGSFATKSYFGMGFTGVRFLSGGWWIQYDLYGGEFQYPPIFQPNPENPTEEIEVQPNSTDAIGGRVTVSTPVSGLSIGLSTFNGDSGIVVGGVLEESFQMVSGRHYTNAIHVEYLTDAVSLRAEYARSDKLSGEEDIQMSAYYIEAAYLFLEHWQAALLFDVQYMEFENMPIPIEIPGDHKEGAVGFNYWFNPNFVLKLSYHYVRGNIFAKPEYTLESVLPGYEMEEVTHLGLFGTQFSF